MNTRALAGALVAVFATAAPTAARASEPKSNSRTMTLTAALAELDARNWTVAQAKARSDEASGLARQALAAVLPVATAVGSYTRNSDEARAGIGTLLGPALPPGVTPPPDLIIQPLEVWNATVAVRVPLLALSSWADFLASLQAVEAAKASAEATRLQLRAAFLQAAWTSAAAEDIVLATERAVQNAEQQAQTAHRAAMAGTGTPLAVLQAQTEAVKRENDLVRARADLQRVQLALGILLGDSRPVRVEMANTPPPAPVDLEVSTLVPQAEQGRPELRAQRALVTSADRQVTSAWLRLVPQLSASAAAFKQDVPFPTGQDEGWRASVELSWTIYDGGLRYGKRTQAAAAAAGARAGLERQRLEVLQQVEDAVRDVKLAHERKRLVEKQQALAAEAAQIARRSFAAGVASSLDVLDANDRLYQAEVAQADAKARVGGAQVALARALGGL